MQIKEYINKNKENFFEELSKFISFKSISTDSCYSDEMKKCQQYLVGLLKGIGAEALILETKEISAVFGELCCHKKAPTVLFYGHYDVQPAHKDEGWEKDPFEINSKNGKWHARGIADDKGPVFAFIKAVETLQNTIGLKLNVKFLIEGEEEGESHLGDCIKENVSRLKCDCVLVCDTEWLNEETIAIPCGLRGIVYAYIRINGPNVDLHSGTFGGMVKNPHLELARILVKLKNEKEKILIPGFYDNVKKISAKEKKLLEQVPLNIQHLENEVGTKLTSDDKVELLIKRSVLPTFEIHGITGGYLGPGGKTIIPSYAEAKLSMRLVPDQNPKEIRDLFVNYIKELNPEAIVVVDGLAEPFLVELNNPYIEKAAKVLEQTFGKKSVFLREGASIPAVVELNKELKVPVVLFGINNHDCDIHSPRENLKELNFYKGIEALTKYLDELSK